MSDNDLKETLRLIAVQRHLAEVAEGFPGEETDRSALCIECGADAPARIAHACPECGHRGSRTARPGPMRPYGGAA